ncbi:Tfp pilus assembly protein FimT/FimU [Xanthomonas melonis]|uniref:Type II secretion system protein H n=1 Tax=Xanthomonas melonis TaxID=56456 RepID=A0ABS8NUG1_9XANT|nr:Tfp pilus assembly protein FimT/FimU [Xanthomonas melonis]MCD0247857.1 Tfp pilus assembly protein FimT/FimU [Xanthomonas melonis]MCD0256792.1 Tfp pilus assembly protein FimT/FimU [Xanthomonas melonis]MCD0266715.1 Tfp pilus assembly protein FimT/FimU [Xanthomonas melonis]MCD0280177.1 Tfp pilus assembly protein FimT/FimU [Xanthomonas melonis]
MRDCRIHGFTLVELMITIAVLAIVAAIGYPSFQGVIRSNRAATANNEVLGLLNLARSEALRSGQRGAICGSSNGTACDGTWGGGILAWGDVNANGALDGGEPVLRYWLGNPKLVVQGPSTGVIAFDGRGRRVSAGDQQVSVRPDQCSGQALMRTLLVNAAGQVRSRKDTC